jgi:hypothetical protein
LDEGADEDFAGWIADAIELDPEPDAVDPRLDALNAKVGEP